MTPTTQSTLTKKQELMWTILTDSYGDQAWSMLEDMKGKRFSHKRANKHLSYIINNWPDEEVCRTVRTWLIHASIDPNKLFSATEFNNKYGNYIKKRQEPFKLWLKP
jgi:hypothetical protein